MYVSLIRFRVKPGKMAEIQQRVEAMLPEIREVEGLKQIIAIDTGANTGLAVAVYESREAQEAAGPVAREILARFSDLYEVPPERIGCALRLNAIF